MNFLIQKPNHSLGLSWFTLTNFLIKHNHLYKEVLISDITTEYQDYTPIGSVEFVEQFASTLSITVPEPVSYPTILHDYFSDRNLHTDVFENTHRTHFVKPVKTKLFTGGIKNTLTETIDPATSVWVCDPIDFGSEFRFYIHDRTISGYSQYDDGEDYSVTPEILHYVNNVIDQYTDQPIGYSIDVGISTTGIKLIEINDGWALGYYKWGTMTIGNYINLIDKRWKEIAQTC